MKSRKQSRVDALEVKVHRLTTMVIGIMETIKRMPDYQEAIEKLKVDEGLQQVSEDKGWRQIQRQ